MVAGKTFREDLLYRLHVVRIHVPPLRERPGDIDLLAAHFVQEACRRNGLRSRKLAPAALAFLRAQRWPGNVRELKNLLEAAAILSEGEAIERADLESLVASSSAAATAGTDYFALPTLEAFREAVEREFIRRKLAENGGNIKRTAELIQIQRSNLYKKLERYGLK
jgi:two-component system nitrogen regulation response regulator NtrX